MELVCISLSLPGCLKSSSGSKTANGGRASQAENFSVQNMMPFPAEERKRELHDEFAGFQAPLVSGVKHTVGFLSQASMNETVKKRLDALFRPGSARSSSLLGSVTLDAASQNEYGC